jgi:hypothetical protein
MVSSKDLAKMITKESKNSLSIVTKLFDIPKIQAEEKKKHKNEGENLLKDLNLKFFNNDDNEEIKLEKLHILLDLWEIVDFGIKSSGKTMQYCWLIKRYRETSEELSDLEYLRSSKQEKVYTEELLIKSLVQLCNCLSIEVKKKNIKDLIDNIKENQKNTKLLGLEKYYSQFNKDELLNYKELVEKN